ncbi:MAG: hypothetical protein C0597_16830 [Marinilabiliales bacterium]|nr:MAG: hypothetical protein C0597_16830 [Marinilabiliales bacterium]
MRFSKILNLIFIVALFQSCATTKLAEDGNTAYEANNYEQALKTYDQLIESRESVGKKAKGKIYLNAGIAALELKQVEKARKYLESARELQYSSPQLYSSLAKVYMAIDNLSKEITALETYRKNYPQGDNIHSINARLLETYVESENWDYAIELWPNIEAQAQSDINMLANYLIVNKNLENTETCEQLSKKIEKLDPNNITLLEYKAEKYFWLAENLYTTEMKAYKNHRTSSQYKKLLKALDKVWPNFQKSRDHFLKLYRIDPKPEYARYLAQIYTRYDDKQKAAYYEKRSK